MAKMEKHSFQALGFAYIIIGAFWVMVGLFEHNYEICPTSSCGLTFNAGFSSGLTLLIAGIILLVDCEARDRSSGSRISVRQPSGFYSVS